MIKKNFQDEELTYESKIRNVFADNMSTDVKLGKAQISKIIQSGWLFGSWFCNLGKKALKNHAIPFTGDNLPELASNMTSIAINKFERKTSGKGAVEQERDLLYLFRMKIWMILLKS